MARDRSRAVKLRCKRDKMAYCESYFVVRMYGVTRYDMALKFAVPNARVIDFFDVRDGCACGGGIFYREAASVAVCAGPKLFGGR